MELFQSDQMLASIFFFFLFLADFFVVVSFFCKVGCALALF